MSSDNCKDKICELNIEKSQRDYLLRLNTEQIDMKRRGETTRKALAKMMEDHDLKLIKHLKIVPK